jgi:hypothetical protein
MSDGYSGYTPKKVSEQRMKAQAGKGDGADVFMDSPRPVGAQRNSAASPDEMFSHEFSAEKDLATLISAAKIRSDKARYGKAVALRDRMAQVRVNKDRGAEPIGERKGPNNQGVRTRANNTYDNRAAASKPTTGTKMDGQKGRW